MIGSYFLGQKKLKTREIPSHILNKKEVLVKVAACGICGTDVHIYHGSKGSVEVQPPVILGHEFSGIVTDIGSEVSAISIGDHVTIDPNVYCGQCEYCRDGKKQLCSNLIAFGVNRNGGFADYCYVPESQCYTLSKNIPLEAGAMAEPLACCIHGIDRLKINVGKNVCIIGGGPIGLIMVQLSKLAGAAKVILSEPVEKRREIGLSLGADAVINPLEESIEKAIQRILNTEGADYVIECVGNVIATSQTFMAARRGASILLFSVPQSGSQYSLQMEEVFHKELTILGSMINPDTHLRAVQLINSGKIQLLELITHRFPIEKLEDAIAQQLSKDSLKVIIENQS